ncbi:dispanin subfamily A member 2b-like [Lates japonicus]|uniref:Dispanin subfamily A member 2b-like protein n=1 Tax=Lates japonicus TaxID=270547 RepID=A0AAD3QXW9_LATJO|nr:dispanin subfamily A member 2b-like protein [Lates japonicus]
MDPNKSATAPPMEWSDQKSSMGQVAPPAYNPHMGGYPQAGYPAPPQGFGPPPPYSEAQYGQQPYPMTQPYPMQPGTVTVQPTVYVARRTLAQPVNDYMGYSIFTMLCCCLPLGIAALIYSISAREANHVGDQIVAERSSRMARTLNHVALGLGLGISILIVVYIVVVASVF